MNIRKARLNGLIAALGSARRPIDSPTGNPSGQGEAKVDRFMKNNAAGAVLALITLLPLAGCSSHSDPATQAATASTPAASAAAASEPAASAGPRALTADEATRLSVMRLNNFSIGTRAITGTITDGTTEVSLIGWVNYVDHVGYALANPASSQTASPFLVQWTPGEVGIQNYSEGPTPPLPVPTTNWSVSEFDPSVSFLANAQAIVLNLAADQPDNPQLLTQSSAQWLRSDTVNGVAVDVFAGPKEADGEVPDPNDTSESRIRYWLDVSGNLQRIEMRIGTDLWSLIDFTNAPGVLIPNPNNTGSAETETVPTDTTTG